MARYTTVRPTDELARLSGWLMVPVDYIKQPLIAGLPWLACDQYGEVLAYSEGEHWRPSTVSECRLAAV